MAEQEKCPECGDALTRWHEPDRSRCRLTQAKARIAELKAIVDKLPKTADGVTVVPGDTVYHPELLETGPFKTDKGVVCFQTWTDPLESEWQGWFEHWGHDVAHKRLRECYSTREAAEAARKGKSDE